MINPYLIDPFTNVKLINLLLIIKKSLFFRLFFFETQAEQIFPIESLMILF